MIEVGCKMKSKKSIFIILLVAVVIVCIIIFFLKNNYKIANVGNNISNKTLDECEKYIFNINSYEATAEITVQSNKNTNKYIVKQNVNKDESLQEILEPENVKGVKIKYKDKKLTITNTELDLKKIYEDYPYIEDNILFLTDFISKYKEAKENNNVSISEEENMVIFTINNGSKYRKNEKLYINEDTGMPIKLIVQDDNKKDTVYILYNETKINN